MLQATAGWITVTDAATALDLDRRKAAKRLARWAEQGWLKRVQRGHYTPIPLERTSAEAPLDDPWIAVPHLVPGGYIGGWTAAHHWDLTEQLFRDVCVIAPGRRRRLERASTAYVIVPSIASSTFGLRSHWFGSTRVAISDPTRTLIDMLAKPEAGPGIQQVSDCLANFTRRRDTEVGALLTCADRIQNGAVFKRLGYLLERGETADAETLDLCRRRLTKGLAKLDPRLPSPRIVTRWRLRVPEVGLGTTDD